MTLESPVRSWLLERLTDRHAELEGALSAEMERPLPDEVTLRRIKREKLAVRDRIAAIERGAEAPPAPAWMVEPSANGAAGARLGRTA